MSVDNTSANNNQKFPTNLIWGVVNPDKYDWIAHNHSRGAVAEVLYTMYPGINLHGSEDGAPVKNVIRELAGDDLNKQFAGKLRGFENEGNAIADLGPEIEIQPVKFCHDTEWQIWIDRKYAKALPGS